jgi:tetratricopeptide (TPR) repeat protein
MSGRWVKWAICGGLVVAAVGCNRNTVRQPQPPFSAGLAKTEPRPSLIESAFGRLPRSNPAVPQVPSEPVAVKPARKPNEPLKPETLVAMGDSKLERAFMEGTTSVERDAFLDAARHDYQQALNRSPKNEAALLGLAKLYAKSGDRTRAVETFQTAIDNNPRNHALVHQMAAIQVQFADWAGAVAACQTALRLDPENRTYHKTLGYCQAQLGQWDEAFDTLCKVMPEAQARYFLGRVLVDHGQLDQAKKQIQAALTLDPQYNLARQTLTDLEAGKLTPPVMQAGHQQ